jgi:hypothetical protein
MLEYAVKLTAYSNNSTGLQKLSIASIETTVRVTVTTKQIDSGTNEPINNPTIQSTTRSRRGT